MRIDLQISSNMRIGVSLKDFEEDPQYLIGAPK